MDRKLGTTIVALLLVFVVTVTAEAQDKPYKGTYLKIITSQAGGGWYPHAGAMASIWEKYLPGLVASAQTSAGVHENLVLLQKKQVEIAFLNPEYTYDMYHGIGNYTGKMYKGIRHLFNIMGGPFHIMTLPGSGIETMSDVRGKRFGRALVGHASDIAVDGIMDVYGIKKDEVKFQRYGRQDMADAIKDKQIDAGLFQINLQAPVIMDLISVHKAKIVPVAGDYKKKILEKYPYYADFPIPKEAYRLAKDVESFGVIAFVGVDASMDEKLAYALTKTYFEHIGEISKIYVPADELTQAGVKGAVRSVIVPLHPGAQRYLKEQGVVK